MPILVEAMMAWLEFAGALVLFYATHAVPARPAIRARLVRRLGRPGFVVGYSLLSLAMLAWLISAAGRAPYEPLWLYAPWERWAPNLVMRIVCLLIAFAVGAPNPLSFGGAGPERFDPRAPGAAVLYAGLLALHRPLIGVSPLLFGRPPLDTHVRPS